MHTSFRSMNVLMLSLVGVLFELNLYIILVSSLSVSQNHHVGSENRIKHNEELHGQPQQSGLQQPLLPDAVVRDNKMDDLFLETPSIREQNDDNQRNQDNKQLKNTNLDAYNTISFDNSIEIEPEMLTNNHQSYAPSSQSIATDSLNSYQNSRHYNNHYQSSGSAGSSSMQSSHHHHYHQNNHYGKYSPNMFANNYNLNYIHSFLTNKPSLSLSSLSPSASSSSSSSSSSLPPSYTNNMNTNSLGLSNQYSSSSSPTHQASGIGSSYISASASLSAVVNNLQQSIAQKQQQLASINSQLQSLSSGGQLSSYLSYGRDSALQSQASPTINNDNNNNNGTVVSEESFGPSLPMCGRQQVAYREPRVVGGNRTYEGEFPWAVSIQRHGNHHCGGVIVGRRWILTAAHCVRSQLVGNLAVRTGGHTLSRSANGINSHLEKDYQVEQIVMHDDFSRYDNLTALQSKSSANTNNADIALLKLKREIHLNDLAWPVCFPDRDAGNFSGHDAIVIGWGKLNEKSEEFSNELQKVKLTIIDNKVCQNWFRQAGRDMPIDDRIICAGFKHGGKDACHGDSGGPLLSRINGQYVVVGVVSTGIGCARPLLPGLYSRVSSYINWIERYITI